jgi:hypothetical protein
LCNISGISPAPTFAKIDLLFRSYVRKFLISEVIPCVAKHTKKIPHNVLAIVLERIEYSLLGTPLDKLRQLLNPIRGTPIGRIFVKELVGCLLESMGNALQNSTIMLDSFVNQIIGNFQFPVPQDVLASLAATIDPIQFIISFGERMLRVLVPFNLLVSIRPSLQTIASGKGKGRKGQPVNKAKREETRKDGGKPTMLLTPTENIRVNSLPLIAPSPSPSLPSLQPETEPELPPSDGKDEIHDVPNKLGSPTPFIPLSL